MNVSEVSNFDKFKQRVSIVLGEIKRRLIYLLNCVERFGISGVAWWFRTYKQVDQLNSALVELRLKLTEKKISFLWLEDTFSQFIIPEEDLAHVYWYTDAHNKLENFKKHLVKQQNFDIKLLKPAMNELKFISQSDEFHRIYQLESIQKRVKEMYQELQQKITDQQSIEKEKIAIEKNQQLVEIAKEETRKEEAIAKSKMMENVKIKEKRLAIIEQKKQRLVEKEVTELKIKEQNEQAEIRAKEAEGERQEKLQDSYRELELEEKIKSMPLEELVEIVNRKIDKKQILTFFQLDQLSKLKHTIEEKKVE